MSALPERLFHIFHWPLAHPIRLLLPGMILCSLLLHALAAYVVRSTPASRPGPVPWPAAVSVIPAGEVSGLLLLAARDPSWLDPGRYRERLVPAPRHESTVSALAPRLPPLLAAPRSEARGAWAPALPPLSVRAWLEPAAEKRAPPSFAPTGARFESGAAGVTEDVLSRLRAVAPERSPGRPTELLVVLEPAGDVRHAWVLRGSGDAALDLAALRAVQRARFAPSGAGTPDVLRIFWGSRGPRP
ncbi:MAG: TonB family protein [Chthoniobacterales bacterium]|jgi:TonB family protein